MEDFDSLQDPSGKTLPNCRAADRQLQLLHDHQEQSAPQRCLMYLAQRPKVVCHQRKQECIVDQIDQERFAPNNREGPAVDGGREQRDRRDQYQALVRRGIRPSAERKEDKRSKNNHVPKGRSVESLGINGLSGHTPAQQIRGRHRAEDHHRARQAKYENAQAPMEVHSPRRNERRLYDE